MLAKKKKKKKREGKFFLLSPLLFLTFTDAVDSDFTVQKK
jgi:hypothetical protein